MKKGNEKEAHESKGATTLNYLLNQLKSSFNIS
jgi:hypothetical protein